MDSPSTPRARNPASKSRFLALRKSDKGIKSSSENDESSNKSLSFRVNFLPPSLTQQDFNVDVTFSPHQSKKILSPVPLYKTPPSNDKNFVPFNPFNTGLQERLKSYVLSPTVFSSIKNPPVTTETEFRWSIEDVARIKPANIEEDFNFDDQMDPEAESQAQEAIEKFFSNTQLAPSPSPNLHLTSQMKNPTAFLQTPCTPIQSAISSTPRRDSSKKLVDACVQTGLSLPPELPEEVAAVLSRYFIQPETDDDSLSTSSMRRKLFFQCEDEPPSPVKPDESAICSPVTSGLASCPSLHQQYVPSTPIIKSRTVDACSSQLSSPEFSPISYNCSAFASPNTSVGSKVSTRLDFSNVSKENIPMDVSSDNAQDSLIKVKGSHSFTNNSYKMSYTEDSENANFSLIKVPVEEDAPKPYNKPFLKKKMEYMNSTSVLMPSETSEHAEVSSQKAGFCWQFSSVSKTCSSEDTGYQSRSCCNTNSELTDFAGSSLDSQQFDSSMELPRKRPFSNETNRKVLISIQLENPSDV